MATIPSFASPPPVNVTAFAKPINASADALNFTGTFSGTSNIIAEPQKPNQPHKLATSPLVAGGVPALVLFVGAVVLVCLCHRHNNNNNHH